MQRYAGLKPLTPLLPGFRGGVKPLLPLLARNARFCDIVGEQRCCRFHVCSRRSEQRCRWFHLGAKKLALRGCGYRIGAKKFAQRAENTPISVFLGLLGEFFRGRAGGAAVLSEFFAGEPLGGVLGEVLRRPNRRPPR